MIRRLALALAIAVGPVALAGCSVNPATGQQSFTAFMSPQEELRVGAEEHPKLVAQFGGSYEDPDVAAYVQQVGERIARVTEFPDLPYSFTVLNDENINAFALPGGYIHITRGLLALANNEAEVAAVLAHEVGHVTARHSAERYSRAVVANLGMAVLGALGQAAGLPAGTGDLAAFGAQAYLQGFSREQELEADTLGLRYMAQAGYDPRAMVSFFRKLDGFTELQAVMAGDPGAADRFSIMASHPRTADRVSQALRRLAVSPRGSIRIGQDAHLARIDGILFGDHPDQGVRRDRDFQHPGLRIAFRVPPGFVMFNDPRRVVARGPGGAMLVFDAADARTASRAGRMTDYLGREWGANLPLRNLERIDVNGMDAATAGARVRTRDGEVDLRLVAIRERDERVYRFLFLTPTQVTRQMTAEMQRTTYSFRRLTREEAAQIKPLRVRVITVGTRDTVDSLAARMPFAQYRTERFLALNGLRPGDQVVPGPLVKIIVE